MTETPHRHYINYSAELFKGAHCKCDTCDNQIKTKDNAAHGWFESCQEPDRKQHKVWCMTCFKKIAAAIQGKVPVG